jgi:hypothetical protein
MFEPRHNLNPCRPFPRRPPRDTTYYTLRLRDITATTITTVVKCENGEDKEFSCITLRDLLVESDSKPIPTCIDTAWIARLSYTKWADAIIKYAAFPSPEAELHEGWKFWIQVQSMQLQVVPGDPGFQAAIAKWFALHSEEPGLTITVFMERSSDEERKFVYVLSILKTGCR